MLLIETIISLPTTDKLIQDDVDFFLLVGWRLISVDIIGNKFKYTIGWPPQKGRPIYPAQINKN